MTVLTSTHSGLDRLRGLFAGGVALGHAGIITELSLGLEESRSLFAFLRAYLGFIWVMGFIVLSGYCIARSTIPQGATFSLGRYALMRITRILPLLLTCAVIAGIFEFLMLESPHRPPLWKDGVNLNALLITAVGLSGFFGQFGSLAPSYTVSYELLYYAMWGCALAALRTPLPTLLLAFAVMGGAFLVGISYSSIFPPFLQPILHPWVMLLGIAWVMGASLFVFEQRLITRLHHIPYILSWAAFLLFLWGGATLSLTPPYGAVTGKAALYYLCLAGCFSLIIAHTVAKPSSQRLSQFDTWLGEISYPPFLIHGPSMVLGSYLLASLSLYLPPTVYIISLFSLSLLLAHGLSTLIEKPVMRWRRRLKSPQGKGNKK